MRYRMTLEDLDEIERLINERAEERQRLWLYGGTRRLASSQMARLWELEAEIEGLYGMKRAALAGLRICGVLPLDEADPAGVIWLLARPWRQPPDPALRQPGQLALWADQPTPLPQRTPAPVRRIPARATM